MIPAAPGQEPAGFTAGPELWLLLLGVVATIGVALIFFVLMRRMIQIEMAVTRDSKAPDFTGLSVVLSSVVDGSVAIQTKGFHKWVADKNESRARVLKSERLYHEERAATRKKQKGDQKGKDLKGKGWGGSTPAADA